MPKVISLPKKDSPSDVTRQIVSFRQMQAVYVGIILLVATGLRVYEIASYSLWLDEAWVGLSSHARTLSDFFTSLSSTPVLFAATTRLFQAVFRQPELGARFFPFICSILTLVLTFRLAKQLQGALGGSIALTLIAFHPVFIHYAKQLKQYSADTAIALAIVWLGLRFLTAPWKRSPWPLVVVATLAPGFSYTALFVNAALVITLGVHALAKPLRDSRRYVAMCLPISVSSLVFFLFAQRYINPSLATYWQGSYLPRHPITMLSTALSRLVPLFSLGPTLGEIMLLAVVVSVIVPARRKTIAPLILLGVVLVAAVGAAVADRYPFGDPRTSLYLIALLIAAAGAGLGHAFTALGQRISWRLVPVGLLVLAAWWGSTIPWHTLSRFEPVEEIGPLVQYLDSHREPHDVIVVYYASMYQFAYYSSEPWTAQPTPLITVGFVPRFLDPNIVILPDHRGHDPEYDSTVRRVAALAGQHQIWVVMSHIYGDEASYLACAFAQVGRIQTNIVKPNADLFLVNRRASRENPATASFARCRAK